MENFSKKRLIFAAAAAALLILSNVITGFTVYFFTRPPAPVPLPPPVLYTAEEIFSRFAPSVCEINTSEEVGTGFIAAVRTDGDVRTVYIATNLHVVESFVTSPLVASVSIKFYKDDADHYKNTEVSVAGYDRYHDIAVLAVRDKLPLKSRQTCLERTNTNPVPAGQILLMGNMSGDGVAAFTHTNASVSNADAVIYLVKKDSFEPLIGVSTDVNGGCSGAPIFDMQGQFIGIGKAQTESKGLPVAGASYAIGAAVAKPLIEKAVVVSNGQAIHKIDMVMKSADWLDLTELQIRVHKRGGVFVVDDDASPYLTSGDTFMAGDVLQSVADLSGNSLSFTGIFGEVSRFSNESKEVPDALKARYTGKNLTVCVLRDGVEKTIVYTNKKEIGL